MGQKRLRPDESVEGRRYKTKEVVWGWFEPGKVWKKAVVVATERPKSWNEIVLSEGTEGLPSYYVHWRGCDRRLDRWLHLSELRKLNDLKKSELHEPPTTKHEPKNHESRSHEARNHEATKHEAKNGTKSTGLGKAYPRDLEDDKSSSEDDGISDEYRREHEASTRFKLINKIQLGPYEIDAWYFSPYPATYQNIDKLFICEFCLSFYKFEAEYLKHLELCHAHYPPGNEIYRTWRFVRSATSGMTDKQPKLNGPDPNDVDGKTRQMGMHLSVWEVDGSLARIYCENLCYLSKLFLDHKTLLHPVNLFLFYILTEIKSDGFHLIGYFSKEKYSRNNVSCILTLPHYQNYGLGKFLIHFSYALSLKEGRRGTPERPLSDLGKASYINYWKGQILQALRSEEDEKRVQGNEEKESETKSEDDGMAEHGIVAGKDERCGSARRTGKGMMERSNYGEDEPIEEEDQTMADRPQSPSDKKNSIIIDKLADQYGMEPQDVLTCLEECDLIFKESLTGKPFIFFPAERERTMLANASRPLDPISPEEIHWLPYDPFMGPYEYAAAES